MSSSTLQASSTGARVVLPQAAGSSETLPNAVQATIDLRQYEIRRRILDQYRRAAQRGEISYLKYLRLRRGVDQKTLAGLADMTQSAVARAERLGHAERMRGFVLRRLARALDVTVDDLLR